MIYNCNIYYPTRSCARWLKITCFAISWPQPASNQHTNPLQFTIHFMIVVIDWIKHCNGRPIILKIASYLVAKCLKLVPKSTDALYIKYAWCRKNTSSPAHLRTVGKGREELRWPGCCLICKYGKSILFSDKRGEGWGQRYVPIAVAGTVASYDSFLSTLIDYR